MSLRMREALRQPRRWQPVGAIQTKPSATHWLERRP